jgi:hypothetical protein
LFIRRPLPPIVFKFGLLIFRRVVGPRLPTTWNYGAVERALRDAANRGERCIFEPTEGYVFESPEEAYEFYNMYSWEQGFGIRYGRSRAGKTGRRTRQDIVCACQVCAKNIAL